MCGQLGETPARIDRKWDLNVRMARSAAFHWKILGWTSW